MHWLDRLSPRLHAQLERYARQWWFQSLVDARRRPGQDLERVTDGLALRAQLEQHYELYLSKHSRAHMDGRTRQHVSTAALCLATYHCLSPHVPKDRLLDIIREQSGGSGTVVRFLVRATSFLQTYGSLQQRLGLLQLDRGQEGFESQLSLDSHMSTLRFSRCLYEDIFEKEEKRDLLGCVCCAADGFWLTGQRFKAGLKEPSKAKGSSDCVFYVINKQRNG